MEISANLNSFFKLALTNLQCQRDTKSYIIGLMSDFKKPAFNYANDSITLLFADARSTHRFDSYQQLADWILFSRTVYPSHLVGASEEYYQTVAKLSYYQCFKMTNKQWLCFEELADRLEEIEEQTRLSISKIGVF